ncbi:MAG: response regulator transcription factor [Myxococcota bacterium]
MAETLLIVEDDVELTELLSEYLTRQGFEVRVEHDGERAISRIVTEAPDAVILDVGLDGVDGLTVCRRVREQYDGPILIYSARGDDVDQTIGLELGADDYVPKPASPRLLVARLRAVLRRREPRALRVDVGPLSINASARSVTMYGEDVELTTAEFDLLWALARNAGRPMSRQELMKACRGIDYDGLDRSLDVRVAKLRQRLGNPGRRLVKTVRGVGYQLAVDP